MLTELTKRSRRRRAGKYLIGLGILSIGILPGVASQDPLPLAVATSLQTHVSRSPISISPDGEWIGSTGQLDETLPHTTDFYSLTGVPLGDGDNRMQASLTNTRTGEVVIFGGDKGSSWSPVWSPDGKKVAYYSDEDGEAGLWIWEKSSQRAQRIPGFIARPGMNYETAGWTSDSKRVVVKILRKGMTLAETNVANDADAPLHRFHKAGPNEPSVYVLRSEAAKPAEKSDKPDVPKEDPAKEARIEGDLAIVDIQTHQVSRIAERAQPFWYAFSPDDKYLAYTIWKGLEPNSQQHTFDLMLYNLSDGTTRVLSKKIRLSYGGNELNWSPDSRRIAYFANGQLAKGEITIVSLDGTAHTLSGGDIPAFNVEYRVPLWDARGENIYALGNDELWRVEVSSGRGSVAADIPGYQMRGIVTHPGAPTMWTTNEGRSAWVLARAREGGKVGIFGVDLSTGKSHPAVEETKSYQTVFNLDGSDTGKIAYVATDQQHPADVWVLDSRTGETHQVTHLNKALEKYELGTARVIEWRGLDGQKLRGSLLLPPGYQAGRRVPLVVWVYGGSMGSTFVKTFGFWGDTPMFDMHVLATRGFAVLFPDSPINPGTPVKDLVSDVIPGVNAAIDQGFADPDRLAVMGQSYGSYCSLALISQTKRFKAAIITAAVVHPDLAAGYLEMDQDGSSEWLGYYEHGQGNMGGTPWEYRDRYLQNSLLYRFDQIETPLLIGQGAKDGRLFASDATFTALKRLGKEVEYRIYEGEGHVIQRKPNVIDFWNRRLEFLAEHLDLTLDEKGGIVFEGDRAKSRKSDGKNL